MIDAVIATLPASQRLVITLRDVQGFSAEEACELLGVSEANQRVLLHRARTRVRSALEELRGRPCGGRAVIEPQIRCVELVELVTEWMEGELDDHTRCLR